ncbi:MAG: thioredoxin family protein [Desulfobacterales bacterium]|jgi:hypothetical protein|nr:thioredoxin family protein [Desulfobacterales bacterium]
MMTLSEETQLRNARREVSDGTVLRLVVTPDRRSSELIRFCERVTAILPQVSFAREEGTEPEPPLIRLPNGIRYQGAPRGNEVAPFIDALTGKIQPLSDRHRERLVGASLHPAELEIFVTPPCTFCPGMVRGLMPLATASPRIQITVIDASLFPETAESRGIQAVPTLVLDGQFRWTGSWVIGELIDLLVTRDPASMGPAALEMLLREGAAQRLARMMAEQKRVFPALLELLCHEKWPVRLGAMVTVEELSALAPDLALQAIDTVWHRFDSVSDQVRGDILFLCGEAGKPSLMPRIRTVLLSSSSVEVKAAAEEALEKLKPSRLA